MKNVTKKNYVLFISLAIFFGFYNIILFTIVGFNNSAAFRISYLFMMASVALIIVARMATFKDRITARDWFFGYPILRWGYIYLIAEFIASVVFMALPDSNVKVALIVQLFIMAIFLVFAVSCLFAKETIGEMEEKVKDKVLFIRSMQADLLTIVDKCSDPVTKTMIKRFAEKMRLSDPMSHETLFELEKDIALEISRLKSDVELRNFESAKERYSNVDQLLDERNRKCKILK